MYLVVCSSLVLIFILIQFLLWTWVEASVSADPTGPVAPRFFGAQVIGTLLLILVCGVGWKPSVRVEMAEKYFEVRQGNRTARVEYERIHAFRMVSALDYHRDYRPYADVTSFVCRVTPEVIIVETTGYMIALGLSAEDSDSFSCALDKVSSSASAPVRKVAVIV